MTKKTTLLSTLTEAGTSAALKYAKDHPELIGDLKAKGAKTLKALQENREVFADVVKEKASPVPVSEPVAEAKPAEETVSADTTGESGGREKKALLAGIAIGAVVAAVSLATIRK